MKKTYSFIKLLVVLLFAGVTTASADEPVTFELCKSTGFWTDWNNNASNAWAKKWESTQEDPHITVSCPNNNMRFWDDEHVMFFCSIPSNNNQAPYTISVSSGWYITGIKLDFKCGQAATQTSTIGSDQAGVSVSLYGDDPVENYSNEEFEHVEVSDLEEESIQMLVSTLTPGTTTFANTQNFIITLAKKTGIEVAEAEFMEALRKYEVYEEEQFPVGTKPGLYGEAERDAFFAAVQAAHGIEDYSEEDITVELYASLKQNMIDTYDALIASRNRTYTLPEGYTYFRIKAAMEYVNDEETVAKYMLGYRSGETYYGIWATPEAEDPLDQYQAIWKITPRMDAFDIENVYAGARFNRVATSTNVTMSADADNLIAFDPVFTTDEDVTYINIRLAQQDADNYFYLHQGGHGGGTGTASYLVGWSTTFDYVNGPAASEWVLEPVADAEAQAIIEAGEAAKAREQFEIDYTSLIENANLALTAAQTEMTETALITDAEQFSSPWTDTQEGTDLGALIDDDPATFWHSNWHDGAVAPGTHWLDVALAEPAHDLVRITIERRRTSGNHTTRWTVLGSNDAEAEEDAWEPVAKLYTPYSGDNTEVVSSRAFDSKGFTHLRFVIDANTGGSGLCHMSGFQLYAVTPAAGSQYANIADQANALNDAIAAQEFTAVADITEEQGATLKAAYDAFRANFVDPTELRDAIAKAEALANGIVIGTNPGYWNDNSLQTALQTAVTEAKAYDEGQSYTVAESNSHLAALAAASEPVLAAARPIQEGKWYNITFGTLEIFEENGWDTVAGEAVTDADDESIEIDEALWGKYVTVATSTSDGTMHYIEPIDAEDVRLGNYLYVDSYDDIDNKDFAQFRFIAVGDSAYLIQNKGTGLFVKALSYSSCSLDIHPSLFTVRAIGFGQNLIVAKDLQGNALQNLHVARSYNQVVTWNADTPGSRSGLYITEAGDATDVSTKFQMDIKPGRIYTFCYPVSISIDDENAGQMWTVNSAEGNTIRLAELKEAAAGRPFIYINGDTDDYDVENEYDAEPQPFKHGYDIAATPGTDGPLKGTYTSVRPGAGYIIVNESKLNAFTVSHAMMENSTVGAHQAYIESSEQLAGGEVEVILTDEEDGIATAIANISRTGDIYTLDGRRVARGNLNTVSRLAPGIYIINGTKVAVK